MSRPSWRETRSAQSDPRWPHGIVPVEPGHSAVGTGRSPAKAMRLSPAPQMQLPFEFCPADLDLGVGVDLEPLREDDVRVFDVAIPDFGEVIIPRRILDQRDPAGRGDDGGDGAGVLVAPTVLPSWSISKPWRLCLIVATRKPRRVSSAMSFSIRSSFPNWICRRWKRWVSWGDHSATGSD